MKTINNQYPQNPPQFLLIAAGTSAISACQVIRTREDLHQVPPEFRVPMIGIDGAQVDHQRPLTTVQPSLAKLQLPEHEVVPARIPDAESRQKAARAGRLCWATPEWIANPGTCLQDKGVGANSRVGQHLFALNANESQTRVRQIFRHFVGYPQQQKVLDGNPDHKKNRLTFTVFLVFSALGGTGSGSYLDILTMLAQIAQSLNLLVRVVPVVIGLGNCDPGNRKIAAGNQDQVLKGCQAVLEGGFRSPQDPVWSVDFGCDPLIFLTNTNNHGEISNYGHLINMVGDVLFQLCYSDLGTHFLQRGIDIHGALEPDDTGEGCSAATLGWAKIHANQEKAAYYQAYRMLESLAQALLQNPDPREAVKHAENTVARLALRELPAEDQALRRLCQTPGKEVADLRVRPRDIFRERRGCRRGFTGCQDLYYAAQHVLESVIPKQIRPALNNEAQSFLQECCSDLQQAEAGYLTKLTGIGDIRHFTEKMQQLLATFETANREKLAIAKARYQTQADQRVRYETEYHRLEQYHWLRRFFCFSAKRRFREEYPLVIESLMQSAVEIAARQLLAQIIYPGIQQVLHAAQEANQECYTFILLWRTAQEQEVMRLYHLPDDFYVPTGKELIDGELMAQEYNTLITQEGGQSELNQRLFQAFKTRFGSLAAFASNSQEAITTSLLEPSLMIAQQNLGSLSVANLFFRLYPTEEAQLQQLQQMVYESDGRVRTTGDADTIIPKIKVLLVPDAATGEKLIPLANKVAPAGGEWYPIVVPEISFIGFFQYRSQISYSQLIAESRKHYQAPTDPRHKVALGANPLLSVAPEHRCPDVDIDADIAQGLVTGHIHTTHSGYVLNGSPHHKEELGRALLDIRKYLRRQYPSRMHIFNDFMAELGSQPSRLFQKISQVLDGSLSDADPLITELGKNPFTQVKQIAEATEFYARQAVQAASLQAGNEILPSDTDESTKS